MTTAATPSGVDYAELNIGRLYLLLPRTEVVRVLNSSALRWGESKGGWCGTVAAAGVDWPVLALDEFLQPAAESFRKRPFCALLRTGCYGFALLADAIMTRSSVDVRPVELPPILATQSVAVSGLALIDDYVAGIASAGQILQRFATLRSTVDGEVLELLA